MGPIGEQCFLHHGLGTQSTQPQFCRIGRDTTISRRSVYFLFSDSQAMVMANVFDQLDAPGLFAAFNGGDCPSFLRPSNSSTPPHVHLTGSEFISQISNLKIKYNY
jgi:hypothetical protein